MTSLRTRLRENRPVVGTLVTLASPEVAEALAISGAEWLFVDMEHSAVIDTSIVQRIVQAVARRCYTVVRVPTNDEGWIKKTLDAGVDGVIIPHVDSAESAYRAVNAAKYPPLGGRSVGVARAQNYGADITGYLGRANDSTALVLQVEDIQAVHAIDDILAVPGVDAVFIGPYDLSGSVGKLGQLDAPDVRNAIARVYSACAAVGMPLGIYAATPQAALASISDGIRFVAMGTDVGMMANSLKGAIAELSVTV